MSTPTTEVAIFKSSDKFQRNPSVVTRVLDTVLKAEGAHKTAYYGQQVQDPTIGYVIVNWDSYEHHKTFTNSPNYGKVVTAYEPCLSSLPDMHHVKLSGAARTALSLPVVHVIVMTLIPGVDHDTLRGLLSSVDDTGLKLFGEHRLAYGQTLEDPNKYVVLCGWPSHEMLKEFLETHRELADGYRQQASSIVTYEEVYATLKSYTK